MILISKLPGEKQILHPTVSHSYFKMANLSANVSTSGSGLSRSSGLDSEVVLQEVAQTQKPVTVCDSKNNPDVCDYGGYCPVSLKRGEAKIYQRRHNKRCVDREYNHSDSKLENRCTFRFGFANRCRNIGKAHTVWYKCCEVNSREVLCKSHFEAETEHKYECDSY